VTASPPSPGKERIGTWLRGKYRIDAVLGTGGMGVVFAVTHRNGRRFALKLLHPEHSVREEFRKRFLREGYIANAVGHQGAVAVLDDDVDQDGSAFLVMELLDGEVLDGILSRHPAGIPLRAALSAGHQALDVLAAAHAKNIIHRDIKPGNLFATRSGELKLLDFGIARLEDASEVSTTRSGMTMGTPAFMSPEQAGGRPIDARGDLYSLGATLFTLLTGRFVHEAKNAQELMIKAATQQAVLLSDAAPHIPRSISDTVDRALAFKPEDRWQSAEAMRDALGEAFRALPGEGELSPVHLAEVVGRSRIVVTETRPEASTVEAASESVVLLAPPLSPPTKRSPAPTTPVEASPSVTPPGRRSDESPSPIGPVATTQRSAIPSRRPRTNAPRALVVGTTALVAGALVAIFALGSRQQAPEPLTHSASPTAITEVSPPTTASDVGLSPSTVNAPSSPSGLQAGEHPSAQPARTMVRAPAPEVPLPARDGGGRGAADAPKDPWAVP
jgi:serine/threonine-protein kinase